MKNTTQHPLKQKWTVQIDYGGEIPFIINGLIKHACAVNCVNTGQILVWVSILFHTLYMLEVKIIGEDNHADNSSTP